MLAGILFAIISAICFGISNAYWRIAGLKDEFSRIVFFRGILALLLFGILWSLSGRGQLYFLIKQAAPTTTHYFQTALICLVCSFGLLFYLQSLRYAAVGIAVALSSVNIFSIITAVAFLGERVKLPLMIALGTAIAGILLINYNIISRGDKWNKGGVYALLAAFCWGVTYALFKYPSQWIGALPLSIMLEATVLVTALVWNLSLQPQRNRIDFRVSRNAMIHYTILAILLFGGTLFFNLGIQRVNILSLNLTGNLTLAVSVLLGYFWLKEGLSGRQLLGIILILLSLLMTQLSG